MYPHSPLWHYLWLAPRAIQVVIFVVMMRRKLYREFPVFFSYTLYEAIQGTTFFLLDHNANVSAAQYWQAFTMGNMGSIALRFGMIWEIFSHVFEPYPALWELGKMIFRWAGVVLLLVGVVVAVYSPAAVGPQIQSGVWVIDRTISIVQCGLLLFLFLFSSYFGLSWRNYVFGIAVGLGIFATQQLVTSSIGIQSGIYSPNDSFRFSTMATYHCCVLMWLFYVMSKEPARQAVGEIPGNDLEVWDRELSRLLHS
jgi:hypothetical protein